MILITGLVGYQGNLVVGSGFFILFTGSFRCSYLCWLYRSVCFSSKVCHRAHSPIVLWIIWRPCGGHYYYVLLPLLFACSDGETRVAGPNIMRHMQ